MTTSEPRSAAYWEARARALETAYRRLQSRLVSLAASLPPEFLDLLEADPPPGGAPSSGRPSPDVAADGCLPEAADVEPDLRRLWTRTAPPVRD